MILLETLAVAFSMYSGIPMPQFEWNKENMRYAMAAFPLIGPVIGLAEYLAFLASEWLGIEGLLRGTVLCILPILITGGIHLDGYSDTEDALASHKSPEEKQQILKDPHVGSFALIRIFIYLLLSFALWTTLPAYHALEILFLFCISRCLSGLSVCCFPLAKSSGLVYTFAEAADKKRTRRLLLLFLLLCLAGELFFGGKEGLAALLAAALVYAFYYRTAKEQFGGLSGDLAGWFLQKCELWMLIGIYLMQILEKRL